MPRSGSRPGGVNRPARSRRAGRAGVGPGPAYRPSSGGGGTKHGGSSGTRAMVWIAAGIFSVPALAFVAALAYIIRGHVA